MDATIDFKPISTIVLYIWTFVIVFFKANESEDELPRLLRMVAEFIDIKVCINFLFMMLLVNHGTTTIETILNWRSDRKRVRDNDIRGSCYDSNASRLTVFDCSVSKIFISDATHAAKNQFAVKFMLKECKSIKWTDNCSHPDTAKGVVDENKIHSSKVKDIYSGNDTARAEDQYHYSKDNSKPDEIIIIPDSNANYNKNVAMNHEQREHEIRRVNKTRRVCSRRKRIRCEENKPSTKIQGSYNFELAFTTDILMAVKPSKKALLLVVLIFSGLSPTATAPIQQDSERRGLYEYKLLLTSNCNYRDIINSSTCQTNEEISNTYIGYCRFADLCDPGFKPICVNGDDGGMLHIYSPRGLTCQKGYRRRAWLNSTDSDVVLVQEEKCPQGRFQSDKSNCYDDACLARHENITYLPEEFAIYSMGDNISPTWIYCDFEKGFYNMDGKFLLAYDDQFMFHSYFCTDVNTCASGKYPLPNGTCVLPCNDDLKRDAHDGFQCKVQSLVGKSSRKENIIDKVDIHPNKEQDETTVVPKAENYGPIEFELTTQNTRFRTTDADDNESATLSTDLIAGLIAGGVCLSLILLTALVLLFCAYRIQHKGKSIRIKNDTRTEYKTTYKADNLSINYVTNGTNNTYDTQPFLANGT